MVALAIWADAAKEVAEMGPLWNYLVTLDVPERALALATEWAELCYFLAPTLRLSDGALLAFELRFIIFSLFLCGLISTYCL